MARMLVVGALLAALAALGTAVFARGSGAAPAAEIQRTFVSTSGSDANPCTRAEPCRNFAAAIANTLAGGEVVALDSGGYGTFTVNKALTVAGAPGAHVAVTAFAGNGVTVNAGASDAVVLRNLYLTGLGGFNGINYLAGASLAVDSVTATGFAGNGLEATAADGDLFVRDSTFRDNAASGVLVNGSVSAEIRDSHGEGNTLSGFRLIGVARGSITGSAATHNGSGYFFQTGAVFTLMRSLADANSNGVILFTSGTDVTLSGMTLSNNANHGLAVSSAAARIGGSTVSGNAVGMDNTGGTLETFQDNLIRGNATATAGTITAVAKG